jgi:hypothetical protein
MDQTDTVNIVFWLVVIGGLTARAIYRRELRQRGEKEIYKAGETMNFAWRYFREYPKVEKDQARSTIMSFFDKIKSDHPGEGNDFSSLLHRYFHNCSDNKLQETAQLWPSLAKVALPLNGLLIGQTAIASICLAELSRRKYASDDQLKRLAHDQWSEVFELLLIMSQPTVGDVLREFGATKRRAVSETMRQDFGFANRS